MTPPLPENPVTRRWLLAILAIGLALHLLSALAVFLVRPEAISTTPDPLDYRLAALNLLDYGQFSFAPPEFDAPQLLRPPLYPLALAGTYLLDGRTGFVMILLQSVAVSIMAWLLFLLLRFFHVPEKVSLVLTALFVLEPLQWLYTLHTMTETFSSLVMLTLVCGALLGKGIANWKHAALFGVGMGILILMKPSATMWVPFLLALVALPKGSWRHRALRSGVAALFLFLSLLPWMIRNHAHTGHWVVSSSSAFNFILFAGTPETVPEDYWDVVTVASYNGHENQVWYAYTTHAYEMLLATKAAILEEADYVSLVARQLAYAPTVWFGFMEQKNQEAPGHGYGLIVSFALGEDAARDSTLLVLDVIVWSVVLALTLLGSWLLLRDREFRLCFLPLALMLVATILVNFQAAWVRVLLPLYPVIFVASGVGVAYLLGLRRARLVPSSS